MSFVKKIVVWLAGFLCVLSILGSIYSLVLHDTVFDRANIKEWLQKSTLYDDNKLVSALIQTSNITQTHSQITLSQEEIATAFGNTFTSDFIKTQTESIVDGTYDWMAGKSSNIKFSVPVDHKRDTLIQELTTVIKPHVASLPVCQFETITTCRPSTLTTTQLSRQLATENVDAEGMLNKPLTASSFSPQFNRIPSNTPILISPEQLPTVYSVITMLLVVLPLIAVLSIGTIAMLTRGSKRIKIFSKLSRHLFFSSMLSMILSIIVLWLGRDSDFGLKELLTTRSGIIGGLLAPFVKNSITGLLGTLLVASSIAAVISLTLWISLRIMQKKLHSLNSTTPRTV